MTVTFYQISHSLVGHGETSGKLNFVFHELENYKEYLRQLKGHLGTTKTEEILTYALYVISMGTNNFLENYYLLPHRRLQYTVEKYQNFLKGIARSFIKQIYKLGAKEISLTGLPPMGEY